MPVMCLIRDANRVTILYIGTNWMQNDKRIGQWKADDLYRLSVFLFSLIDNVSNMGNDPILYIDYSPKKDRINEKEKTFRNIKNRIQEFMGQRNWTLYRVEKESGVSWSALKNLFERNIEPTVATLMVWESA